MTSSSDVPARLAAVRETMYAGYAREHEDPWITFYRNVVGGERHGPDVLADDAGDFENRRIRGTVVNGW